MSTRDITNSLINLDPADPENRAKRMELMVNYMKDYMSTYDQQAGYRGYTDRTFVEDILYVLGVCLDAKNHQFANGFDLWKAKLRKYLEGDEECLSQVEEPEAESEEVEYWVGDLCYVLGDVWDKVCNLLDFDDDAVEYKLEDGRKFVLMGTAYGDGVYEDQFGNPYPVDAGVIGAIKSDDIRDPKPWMEGGKLLTFEGELNASNCSCKDGVIRLNGLEINTGDSEWPES